MVSSAVVGVVRRFPSCSIKKGSDQEVIVNCLRPAKGLDAAMAAIGFRKFSSVSAAIMGRKGRDIWYHSFRGTGAAWARYLRTGIMAGELSRSGRVKLWIVL